MESRLSDKFESLCDLDYKTILTSGLYMYLETFGLSMTVERAQKILSPVPYEQGFHFFMPDGHYLGETAASLCIFLKDLENIDAQSIRFHFDRGDFQKWIKNTLGDEELALRIEELEKRIPDKELRQQLVDIVQKRISELQLRSD